MKFKDVDIDGWRIPHGQVIDKFLHFLNKRTDEFILKGGTSLMMCYHLDRFSEDIDLDGKHSRQIRLIVDEFCKQEGFSYRIAKDTDTVKRFMINYGNIERPLKIEISYRRKNIPEKDYTKINGITVYKLPNICIMKLSAYNSRDKIRDLYDVVFICNNYWEQLPEYIIDMVRTGVEMKGIEQFDYLINTQCDELIDSEKLETDFLLMYDKLGLLSENSLSDKTYNEYYIVVTEQELNILKRTDIDFSFVPNSKIKGEFIVKTSLAFKDDIENVIRNFKNKKL